jgi:hypothetical protein
VGGKAAARYLGESRNRRGDVGSAVQDSILGGAAPGFEAPEPVKRRKKDTRRWCKGVKGREHVTEVCIRPQWRDHHTICGPRWGGWWTCFHVEMCVICGKIVRAVKSSQCPARG